MNCTEWRKKIISEDIRLDLNVNFKVAISLSSLSQSFIFVKSVVNGWDIKVQLCTKNVFLQNIYSSKS